MSVDRTLKSRDALVRHRNVLTRAERLEALADEGRWEEGKNSVFALPKVAHRKIAAKKKKEAKAETTAEGLATEAGAAEAKPAES